MKILISTPSCREPSHYYSMSMMRLIPHMAKIGVETEIRPMIGCSLLSEGRQNGVFAAMKGDFTHLLFIDDDMAFDTKAVDSLISRDKYFVTANYVTKGEGSKPVVNGMNNEEKIIYSHGKTGIQQILQCGLGFALMKVDMVKKIPLPHFEVPWVPDKQAYLSEDIYFCRLLTHCGVEMFVDHDASKYVAHMGVFPFRELDESGRRTSAEITAPLSS